MRKARDVSSSDASTETTSASSATASAAGSAAPAPASLPGRLGAGPYRVIMVCTGNICRSAMAEIVLRDRLGLLGGGRVELPVHADAVGLDPQARDAALQDVPVGVGHGQQKVGLGDLGVSDAVGSV